MKYGEATLKYNSRTSAFMHLKIDALCFRGLEEIFNIKLQRKAITFKTYDEPGDGTRRWLLQLGQRDNKSYPSYNVSIEGSSTEADIFPEELEAIGIKPENNIYFWIEVWQ